MKKMFELEQYAKIEKIITIFKELNPNVLGEYKLTYKAEGFDDQTFTFISKNCLISSIGNP